MSEATDMNLVREFAERNSEWAFAELVRRHLNLAYSIALRFSGNAADAEDIALAVFVILAKKAPSLRDRSVLTGWIYETTRLVALQNLRSRARRHQHEQEAHMESLLQNQSADPSWSQIAPHLEAAMSRLSKNDRTLLALLYFENRTAEESAALLGIGAWTARKRSARALEKLRKYFSTRGVNSTAAIIAESISVNSLQPAPAALATSVTAIALAKGAAASASTLTLIQGALKIMAWTKAKTAIAATAAVLLSAGTAALLLTEISRKPDMTALQGTWTGQEIGAGPDLATMVVNGSNLEFRGADPAEWYKATVSLERKTTPKQAVITITESPEPQYVGKTTRVIYQLEGDTFTVAGNEPGDPSLPQSFDAPTARKFVLKKKSGSTAPILAASTLVNAANDVTSPTLEVKNAESIPGWGDVINPDGDCTLAFANGKLTLNLPGTEHILTPESHRTNAPRVMQEVTGPFDMQVKVTEHFSPNAKTPVAGRNPYQGAGLLVWMDDANNLKLTPAHSARDGRGFRFFNLEFRHEGQRGGLSLPKEAASLLRTQTYYLRLQIHKDQTIASVSGDGVKWFSTSLPGSGKPEKVRVGIIGENNTTSPFKIDFEEFSLKSP